MFLGKTTYQNAIKGMLMDEGPVDIAVPSLSNDAVSLFRQSRNSEIRLICNLQDEDCNPNAVAAIASLKNVSLRTVPNLHARTLVNRQAVIIGSADISAQGLSLDGGDTGALIEAGVIVDNPDTITQARRWFSQLWADASPLAEQNHENSASNAGTV